MKPQCKFYTFEERKTSSVELWACSKDQKLPWKWFKNPLSIAENSQGNWNCSESSEIVKAIFYKARIRYWQMLRKKNRILHFEPAQSTHNCFENCLKCINIGENSPGNWNRPETLETVSAIFFVARTGVGYMLWR